MNEIVARFINNIPVCISLSFLLLGFSLNYFVNDSPNKLGLVTINTLIANSYIWNLVSSCFFESSLIKLILDILGIIVYFKQDVSYVPVDQFYLYFSLSILACTVGTSVWCFARFFFTGLDQMLLEPVYGFGGVLIILLMHARTQVRNETIIPAIPNLTYNNLPILILFIQLIFWIFGLKFLAKDISFTFISILFSWSYLRFYMKNDDGTITATSDDLSFVAMFPEATQVIVVPLTTAFYNIMTIPGIFPSLETSQERKQHHHLRYAENTSNGSLPTTPLPSKHLDAVAERRRAKAMKLLDAKMMELNKESDGWGEEDDDDLHQANNVFTGMTSPDGKIFAV